MKRYLLFLTGLNGAAAVALGAFGAHGLKNKLIESGMLTAWETAAHYHLAHAVACLGILAWGAASPEQGKRLQLGLWMWLAGCLLFAGSLYFIALDGPRWLGPITPLGGIAFLIGWLLVAKEALHHRPAKTH